VTKVEASLKATKKPPREQRSPEEKRHAWVKAQLRRLGREADDHQYNCQCHTYQAELRTMRSSLQERAKRDADLDAAMKRAADAFWNHKGEMDVALTELETRLLALEARQLKPEVLAAQLALVEARVGALEVPQLTAPGLMAVLTARVDQLERVAPKPPKHRVLVAAVRSYLKERL